MHAGKVTVDMLMLRRLTSLAGNTWCILNVSGRKAKFMQAGGIAAVSYKRGALRMRSNAIIGACLVEAE